MEIALIELLKGIEVHEHEKLHSFASQGYWNLNRDDKLFLEELIREPKNMLVTHQRWIRKKGNKLKAQKLKLVDVIENFLFLEFHKKQSYVKELFLADFYNKKGLYKNFKLKVNEIKRLLNRLPITNETNLIRFQLYELQASNSRQKHEKMPELGAMLKALNQYYTENIWRLRCEFINQKEILNAIYEEVGDTPYINLKPISELGWFYQNVYKMYTSGSKRNVFDLLKVEVLKKYELYSASIIKTMILHLMIYAIRRMNKGSQEFAQEYVYLGEWLIKRNLFLEEKKITIGRFKNMIAAYLITTNYSLEKIHCFINAYYKKVAIISNEKVYQHYVKKIMVAYAECYFNQFEQCSDEYIFIERPPNSFDAFYWIMYYKLKLKILSSTENYDAFERIQKSFQAFIAKEQKMKDGLSLAKIESLKIFMKLIVQYQKGDLNMDIVDSFTMPITDKLFFISKLKK